MTAVDLCCGAGGWACAARGLPIRFLFAVDRDPVFLLTHRANHPHIPLVRADVRRFVIRETTGERVDLVLGGIPCETISRWRQLAPPGEAELAGWRRTFDACLEIVKLLKPRWWCLEDIIAIERQLPVMVPYGRLNSARFSGQRRKRTFVGWFPDPEPNGAERKVLGDYLRPGPYRLGLRSFRREPRRSQWFGSSTHSWLDPERKAPTICKVGSRRPES